MICFVNFLTFISFYNMYCSHNLHTHRSGSKEITIQHHYFHSYLIFTTLTLTHLLNCRTYILLYKYIILFTPVSKVGLVMREGQRLIQSELGRMGEVGPDHFEQQDSLCPLRQFKSQLTSSPTATSY